MVEQKLPKAKPVLRPLFPARSAPAAIFEALEDRRLMSASLGGLGGGHGGRGGHGGPGGQGGPGGGPGATILLSQAPAKVQLGIGALEGTTTPLLTQTVRLGNSNGVETYTVDVTATGTTTRLTVDQNGVAVTAPTQTTATLATLNNAAITAELAKIAAALSLTAPATTATVNVSTPVGGAATYTVALSSATTTTNKHGGGTVVTLDALGNPIGNERLPLGTLSTAVHDSLLAKAPTLTDASLVDVRTLNGVTFYSATYTGTGTRTTLTVNAAGTLTSLPSATTVLASAVPSLALAELKLLATADGFTGDITTLTFTGYDEGNGTTVYSVNVPTTQTSTSGSTYTLNITVSADQLGNPTIPPFGGPGFGGCGGFGF